MKAKPMPDGLPEDIDKVRDVYKIIALPLNVSG